MYLLVSVRVIPMVGGQHNIVSITIIMLGLIFMATGWLRIFRRRPGGRSTQARPD
jgi:hypothetical protein